MVESMNASKIRLCGKILTKLMDHKSCWLFNKPVDPVLYGIPDYFDVIHNPMDLGTVKKKLTSKQYVSTSEFAADVRLTFSNAMKYNPPGNDVHTIAEQLNRTFESEWQSMERKWDHRNPVQEQQPMKLIKDRAAIKLKSVIPRELVAKSDSLANELLINPISSKVGDALYFTLCTLIIVCNISTILMYCYLLSGQVKIKFSVRGSKNTSSKGLKITDFSLTLLIFII
jgi:hypothetical protein